MKILVLNGSPRRGGNTDSLVKSFAEGAENHEVEIINVCDLNINPCKGCNACFGGITCAQKDDMTLVYEKLKSADALIVASPVYFYGISAQLKAAVDRCHTPARNEFKIKKLGLILVGAATLPELFDSILTQYKLILNFFKLRDMGTVQVRGAKDKGTVSNEDLDKARALGGSV
ncbi:MAG: flavodoxin family protein [Clostridia bacterium]|nr:flavodoxin family protein [Clostridia bacterium]